MTEFEYQQQLTAAVREAMANNETLAGLRQQLDVLTAPKPGEVFNDEEQAAMAKAVADLRQRKAMELKQHEEDAELNAFRKEVRHAGITGGYVAPETPEEKELWRSTHGTPFDGNLRY